MPVLHAAVQAGPDHGPARLTLARALFGSRDLAGAAVHAEQAVRLLPDDPDAHDFVGRVRAAQGRLDEARTAFHRALQIDPLHADARDHVARLSRVP
jgi:cytochrome c-type biogenesis protein CcmH/NrfG